MRNWYKKQPITIKGAITGGLFAILAAIITILPDVLMHTITADSASTVTALPQKNASLQIPTLQHKSATPSINFTGGIANPTSLTLPNTSIPSKAPILNLTATLPDSSSPGAPKIAFTSLHRLTLLSFLEINNQTKINIARLDTVFRPNRSSSLVVIPNYPLKSEYTLDEYGYLLKDGQPIDMPEGSNYGDYLDIDFGTWKNYLGVFDFVIPIDKNLQFCGFYMRSENDGQGWQNHRRFIYSFDMKINNFKVEKVSYLEIRDCTDERISNWARQKAEIEKQTSDEAVCYWNKDLDGWYCWKSNSWQQYSETLRSFMKDQEFFKGYPASSTHRHVSLNAGELLIGTAVRFAARAYDKSCNTIDVKEQPPYTIFFIKGPIELDMEINNGSWDHWVNLDDDEKLVTDLLDNKRDEVKKLPDYEIVRHVECLITTLQ